MMDNQTTQLIQAQLNRERYNAQVYFCIAAACENLAYDGFATFFRKQANEELGHAQKFSEFLISKRVMPEYRALDNVQMNFDLVNMTAAAAQREKATTEYLKELYDQTDDPQIHALLDWFLTEQIEEENWSQDLADLVNRTDPTGWIVLSEQYGDR